MNIGDNVRTLIVSSCWGEMSDVGTKIHFSIRNNLWNVFKNTVAPSVSFLARHSIIKKKVRK